MNVSDLANLLSRVAKGECTTEEALLKLKEEPFVKESFSDLGYAKIDNHRAIRQGAAEVIYGAGKTASQIAGICQTMLEKGQKTILITRVSEESFEIVQAHVGELAPCAYYPTAHIGFVGEMPEPTGAGTVVVACAGTSDLPVAEEAALTAEALGNKVNRLYDVGVSGIHRLLTHLDDIMSARVIIAVAGMEGALASVVGGMASCPVIAVPTSVGYGASFGGVAALLAMLNSCASGVSVVNIDNGFGAGFQAHLINHLKGL